VPNGHLPFFLEIPIAAGHDFHSCDRRSVLTSCGPAS
jgi:hypothetical protein